MSKEAMKLALEALESKDTWGSSIREAKERAITALREALAEQPEQPHAWFTVDEPLAWADQKLKENPQWAEQPAQQEPVAAECKFDREEKWVRCEIAHHNLVQSEPEKWPGYQTRLLYTSHQPARQQEPVRIYDYVWPQREEHKDECIYACSYTPSQHLERGELLAVVHPSQLINTYLQREGETAENPLCTSPPAQREPLTDEEIKQFASKHLDVGDGSYATHFVTGDVAFARAIEAAHGIKGDA